VPVTSIKYIKNDTMAASASVDGQIVLWDMTANKDKKALTQVAIIHTPIV
jgi:WD40 repeat protein